MEYLEDLGLMGRGNADSIVSHTVNTSLVLNVAGNVNVAFARRVEIFQGIGNQVRKNTIRHVRIPHTARQRLDRHHGAALVDLVRHRRQDLPKGAVHIQANSPELRRPNP